MNFKLPDTIRKLVPKSDVRALSQKIGYQISQYKIPSVWRETKGEGITVAVIDSGSSPNHEDLKGAYVATKNCINPTSITDDATDNDSHGCVSPDTQIHTSFCGIETIETLYDRINATEIKVDDGFVKDVRNIGIKTYSLSDNKSIVSNITHVHKTRVKSDTIKIQLVGHITYELTPWHLVPILLRDSHGKHKTIKKRADQLKCGDNMIFGSYSDAELVKDYYIGYGNIYRQCLHCGHIPSVYKPRKIRCQCHKCLKSKWVEARTKHLINEDLAYLIGVILTDGHITNNRNYRAEISSCTEEILNKCLHITTKYGFGGKISSPKNRTKRLLINSKDLVVLLINLGIRDKQKSYYQKLPAFVGKSPKSVISSFIAGVIDGDGCISKTNHHNRITTVSVDFAKQMSALLNSLGIHCGLQYHTNYRFGTDIINEKFPIINCSFSALPQEIVTNLARPVKKERSQKQLRCIKKASRIVSVQKQKYDGWFYDFTVDAESHTYIANGHFVSNTHVAGIIAARDNAIGIVGVAPQSSLIAIKALGDDGNGSFEAIIKGIEIAIQLKADIINMSLGSPVGDSLLQAACKKAYDANIPLICAAGNSGTEVLDFPAQYEETISVGALDARNTRAVFSQYGSGLDFMAPGVDILSTTPNNTYSIMSGSSMSAPWLAGIVALLLSKHKKNQGKTPIHTVEDVRNHLKCMATTLEEAGTGFGFVDVSKMREEFVTALSLDERFVALRSKVQLLEKRLLSLGQTV